MKKKLLDGVAHLSPSVVVPHPVSPQTVVDRNIPKITYTVEEACRATGLGRTYIFGLIRDGSLPALKAGTRTLLPEDGIRLYLASLPTVQPKVAA